MDALNERAILDSDLPDMARKALRLCLDGDRDGGLALFRKALKSPLAYQFPFVLHAKMLAESGQIDTAMELRCLLLRAGADLNADLCVPGLAPDKVCASYEALFAAGTINSTMITNYLALRSRMGDADTVARHMHAGMITAQDLNADLGDPDGMVDAAKLRDELLAQVDDSMWWGSRQSIRDSYRITFNGDETEGEIGKLFAAMRVFTDRYRQSLVEAEPSLLRQSMPDDYHIESWVVISKGPGRVTRHIHPRGWITGVFYAASPEATWGDDDQGALRIGRPANVDENAPGWPDLTIPPVPGRLLLMPSHASHWSIPLKEPGLRIAIAMDVVDDRRGHVGPRV